MEGPLILIIRSTWFAHWLGSAAAAAVSENYNNNTQRANKKQWWFRAGTDLADHIACLSLSPSHFVCSARALEARAAHFNIFAQNEPSCAGQSSHCARERVPACVCDGICVCVCDEKLCSCSQ